MFKAIGSVFSKLGKSAAFKGTLAAVGTAFAGELGARLSGAAATRGYQPTPQAQAAGTPQTGMLPTGFGFGAAIPWGPILLVGAALFGGYLFFSRGK